VDLAKPRVSSSWSCCARFIGIRVHVLFYSVKMLFCFYMSVFMLFYLFIDIICCCSIGREEPRMDPDYLLVLFREAAILAPWSRAFGRISD
jgi:hypothetical protein